MRQLSDMTEIYPNIFRASPKTLYIRIANGNVKFCSQERFEKLMKTAGNDPAKLVAGYRTRHTSGSLTITKVETPEQKRDRLKAELAETEKLIETPDQKRKRLQAELDALEATQPDTGDQAPSDDNE